MMHRGRVKDDDVVGRINQRYVGDPTRKILIVVKNPIPCPTFCRPIHPNVNTAEDVSTHARVRKWEG